MQNTKTFKKTTQAVMYKKDIMKTRTFSFRSKQANLLISKYFTHLHFTHSINYKNVKKYSII